MVISLLKLLQVSTGALVKKLNQIFISDCICDSYSDESVSFAII
jgi:hypothetical protein